jgi:hypothetical protein
MKFNGGVGIEHSFGREYQTKTLSNYDLIIHCGGCMLDQQVQENPLSLIIQGMMSRLSDLEQSDVPITNYGLLLSFLQSKSALERVLKPFGYNTNERFLV